MKATKNITDRNERSQKSLLRKMADFVTHPAMANFTHSGPGSLPTGQGGAFSHVARGMEYRGSVTRVCQEECRHPNAASPSAARDFAYSAEF